MTMEKYWQERHEAIRLAAEQSARQEASLREYYKWLDAIKASKRERMEEGE